MILVCAATRAELGACERGIRGAGADGALFATLLTGVASTHARARLEEHLRRAAREGALPSLIVSTGFAGAASADLEVGAWITASRLVARGPAEDVGVEVELRQAPDPARPCVVASVDELFLGAGDQDRRGADAVDMESASLGAVAAAHRIPLMVLRLVSDTPDKPLPGFVAPFTAVMAGGSAQDKLANAARGLRGVLGDPRGVARLVRDGSARTRDLAEGWTRFARLVRD